MANTLKSKNIFNDSKINSILKTFDQKQASSLINLVKGKSADEKKELIKNISTWFKKFKNVKGGHFTVWTNKIKKAIDDLNKIDASEIADKFIKKINEQKENEVKEEKKENMYGKEHFEKMDEEINNIEKIKKYN